MKEEKTRAYQNGTSKEAEVPQDKEQMMKDAKRSIVMMLMSREIAEKVYDANPIPFTELEAQKNNVEVSTMDCTIIEQCLKSMLRRQKMSLDHFTDHLKAPEITEDETQKILKSITNCKYDMNLIEILIKKFAGIALTSEVYQKYHKTTEDAIEAEVTRMVEEFDVKADERMKGMLKGVTSQSKEDGNDSGLQDKKQTEEQSEKTNSFGKGL